MVKVSGVGAVSTAKAQVAAPSGRHPPAPPVESTVIRTVPEEPVTGGNDPVLEHTSEVNRQASVSPIVSVVPLLYQLPKKERPAQVPGAEPPQLVKNTKLIKMSEMIRIEPSLPQTAPRPHFAPRHFRYNSGMNIRAFHPLRDYPTVKNWWIAHNWTPVHITRLPKIGRVIEHDGTPIAAAWLYKFVDGYAGWVEYTISNPETKSELRKEALLKLLASFEDVAKEERIDCLLTFTNHPSLIERFKDCGFQVADQNITMLMRKL